MCQPFFNIETYISSFTWLLYFPPFHNPKLVVFCVVFNNDINILFYIEISVVQDKRTFRISKF